MQTSKTVEGRIVDVLGRRIFTGSVSIENGRIASVREHPTDAECCILPGFVDAHVHIESSMMTPENFGRAAVAQGTVGVVTDPHEIANVCGTEGIEFMLKNSGNSPVRCFFTIPSCVPACPFDSSGAVLGSKEVEALAASGRFVALSEMMNVPGVLFGDSEVMAKIQAALKYGLPVDGHSPLLSGEDLKKYAAAGISTDHECSEIDEAKEKIEAGMKVLIREGSAARNFAALHSLIPLYPDSLMFCTDDAHPEEILVRGHIRDLVSRSVAHGYDLFDVLKVACVNPVLHYNLDLGLLREGDSADFIVVGDLRDFPVRKVYVGGEEKFCGKTEDARSRTEAVELNSFNHGFITPDQLVRAVDSKIRCISLKEGELLTPAASYIPPAPTSNLESDIREDLHKIVYINRYSQGVPQIAYVKGFGLKRGAFASSVAHDSHNIIAVGCNDSDICSAVNAIIASKGGIAAACGEEILDFPLPIGGIMSDLSAEEVSERFTVLDGKVKEYGSRCQAPFMILSFMSLIVIPELKIGEKGLFDSATFSFVGLEDPGQTQ